MGSCLVWIVRTQVKWLVAFVRSLIVNSKVVDKTTLFVCAVSAASCKYLLLYLKPSFMQSESMCCAFLQALVQRLILMLWLLLFHGCWMIDLVWILQVWVYVCIWIRACPLAGVTPFDLVVCTSACKLDVVVRGSRR
jgi:hypothetical protein